MRDVFARLRAALTPQALLALASALVLLGMAFPSDLKNQTSDLEEQTARVLSSVSGAGKVDVVIRMQREESGALSADSGRTFPVGAVAVAQGADDPIVRLELQQALCALLSLPASSVSIVTGGQ